MTEATVDVLIPTYNRLTALAVTMTSLCSQVFRRFRVLVSDQSQDVDTGGAGEIQAIRRVLNTHGNRVEFFKHLPRRGIAEQREFLLDQVQAPYALFLDDDLILEPFVIERLVTAIREEKCGFVGSAVIGLSFIDDIRPQEQAIEFWDEPVKPETVKPGTPAWERSRLHNAANLFHVQEKLGLTPEKQRKYHVAWVGACVMYDTVKLRDVGGFSFWRELPSEHSGEDVLVQLRLMAEYGGCAIIPSGVYHQELATTVADRTYDAPRILDLDWRVNRTMARRSRDEVNRLVDTLRQRPGLTEQLPQEQRRVVRAALDGKDIHAIANDNGMDEAAVWRILDDAARWASGNPPAKGPDQGGLGGDTEPGVTGGYGETGFGSIGNEPPIPTPHEPSDTNS